jgi:hypothetical protein
VFLVALAAGWLLALRLLPALDSEPVGQLALITVSLLLGMALATVALEVYEVARELSSSVGTIPASTKPDLIAQAIATCLRDGGPLLGLAAVVYLLAPGASRTLSERARGGQALASTPRTCAASERWTISVAASSMSSVRPTASAATSRSSLT